MQCLDEKTSVIITSREGEVHAAVSRKAPASPPFFPAYRAVIGTGAHEDDVVDAVAQAMSQVRTALISLPARERSPSSITGWLDSHVNEEGEFAVTIEFTIR